MAATNKLLTTAQALTISNEILDRVKNKGYALNSDLTTLNGKVTTLIGSDASKSVRTIANEELAAQLIPSTAKEALDTLAEIAAWIQDHPDEAAAINAKLTLGTHEVDGEQVQYATVKAYVEAYVASQISAAELGGSNAISISNNVVSLIVDTANANGLSIGANGLGLAEASTSAAGAMSAADKAKLNGIEAQANKYIHPTYTATSGAETADQTPGFGGTFSVSQVVSDGEGHITGQTARTVTIPNAEASASAAGLMSASDKTKLDDVEVASASDITALIAQLNTL